MKTLPLLATLLFQASPLDDYYKFKKETLWTYKRVENGAERKITGRVSGEAAGKVNLEWKEFEKDGSVRETSLVAWSVKDGVLTADAGKEGEEPALSFAVLKEGSKKDDKWTVGVGDYVHQGTVEVTVPAGTYKNAVRVRLVLEGDTKIDFTLVPKVGLVKIDIQDGSGGNTFELVEFKEAK